MAERSMSFIAVARQCGGQDLLRQLAEAILAKWMGLRWRSESLRPSNPQERLDKDWGFPNEASIKRLVGRG